MLVNPPALLLLRQPRNRKLILLGTDTLDDAEFFRQTIVNKANC